MLNDDEIMGEIILLKEKVIGMENSIEDLNKIVIKGNGKPPLQETVYLMQKDISIIMDFIKDTVEQQHLR